MDIKVITRHAPSNYGSLLQSIATLCVLKELGHQAKIIDYVRFDEIGFRKVQTEARLKSHNIFKRILYLVVRYPIEKYAELRFDNMRRKYLSLTPKYHTSQELENLHADIFLTGSDQVWGPIVNGTYDSAYFLSFVNKSVKVRYAASFRRDVFDLSTQVQYKEMLSSYKGITVREDSAVKLLHELNIDCLGQVLDPTLLLSKKRWCKLLDIDETLPSGKPYILVYQIHNDRNLSNYAIRLSQNKNIRLVRVNPFFHQITRGGYFICCPELKDFISLIMNATYIVTDSFHGTCFSIIFNKQFVEILPNNKTGTRNMSLLQLFDLSSRVVSKYSDFSIVDHNIQYDNVNKLLEYARIDSLNKMKMLLK